MVAKAIALANKARFNGESDKYVELLVMFNVDLSELIDLDGGATYYFFDMAGEEVAITADNIHNIATQFYVSIAWNPDA